MRKVLIVAILLLAIPSCLSICVLSLAFLPVGLAFGTPVQVINETNEKLQVSVMSHFSGGWTTVPLLKNVQTDNAFDSITQFEIASGEELFFHYDSENLSADALLIVRLNGQQLILPGPSTKPAGHRCFRIQTLGDLTAPPAQAIENSVASPRPHAFQILVFAFPFTLMVCLCLFLWWYYKPRQASFLQ